MDHISLFGLLTLCQWGEVCMAVTDCSMLTRREEHERCIRHNGLSKSASTEHLLQHGQSIEFNKNKILVKRPLTPSIPRTPWNPKTVQLFKLQLSRVWAPRLSIYLTEQLRPALDSLTSFWGKSMNLHEWYLLPYLLYLSFIAPSIEPSFYLNLFSYLFPFSR